MSQYSEFNTTHCFCDASASTSLQRREKMPIVVKVLNYSASFIIKHRLCNETPVMIIPYSRERRHCTQRIR